MRRDRALEALDALTAKGYTVNMMCRPEDPRHGYRMAPAAEAVELDEDRRHYRITVDASFGFDRIDLRALCDIGEQLGMDVSTHHLSAAQIVFSEPNPNPTPDVVAGPRRHPR